MAGAEGTTDLLALWDAARRRGEDLSAGDLCPDDPDRRGRLEARIEEVRRFYRAFGREGAGGPSAAPLLPTVEGFEIYGEMGRGGMGVVYLARQAGLGRLVALKRVKAGGSGSVGRFRDEARAIAALSHPNIVAAYTFGESDGHPYLAFEFLAGGTLADRWGRQPQPPEEVARLVGTLAEATRHAHDRGVVHRDLKPENVLFSEDGVPKVGDFGLARLLDADDGLTFTGDILGTPGYMAPEQATGGPDRAGPAVDVFALGAILYEGLTGRPPFQGADRIEALRLLCEAEPAPPRRLRPGVPRDLETVCLTCLEKDPRRRYPGAGALAEDLRRFLEGEPVQARRPGPWRRARRLARRRPAAAAGLAALAVAAAGLAAQEFRWRAEARRAEVRRLVDSLEGAPPGKVPALLRRVRERPDLARPVLREHLDAPTGSRRRLVAALALLPEEPGLAGGLAGRLLDAGPDDLGLIRAALPADRAEVLDPLWRALDDPTESDPRRLRAACALAGLDPAGPGWEAAGPVAARLLAAEEPAAAARWAVLLRPAARRVLPPLAASVAGDVGTAAERRAAARLYATLASGTPDGFEPLEALAGPPGDGHGVVGAGDAAEVARRRAGAAAALIAAGRGGRAWPLLRHSADPTVRSHLIEAIAAAGVLPEALFERLGAEPDVSARRALVLALGGYDPDRTTVVDRERALGTLMRLYREEPDAGLHGALHWLLKRWGLTEEIRAFDHEVEGEPPRGRRWMVNCEGQIFSVIDVPPEAGAGGRPYRLAVGSNEVVNYRFQRFVERSKGVGWPDPFRHLSPKGSPALGVLRAEAAAYCNWLSRMDGLPEEESCYVRDEGARAGGEPLRLADDFRDRLGYRLPTESEWSHACRAGAETPYAFGADAGLLRHYGWFFGNAVGRARVVGLLKPNDFGLVDTYGNAMEMCEAPGSTPDLVLCGGAYSFPEATALVVDRNAYPPDVRGAAAGFRLVRRLEAD